MTKEEFSQLVARAIEADLSMKLADEYGVAFSTINRWKNGVAYPLPRLMEVIAKFIRSNGVE